MRKTRLAANMLVVALTAFAIPLPLIAEEPTDAAAPAPLTDGIPVEATPAAPADAAASTPPLPTITYLNATGQLGKQAYCVYWRLDDDMQKHPRFVAETDYSRFRIGFDGKDVEGKINGHGDASVGGFDIRLTSGKSIKRKCRECALFVYTAKFIRDKKTLGQAQMIGECGGSLKLRRTTQAPGTQDASTQSGSTSNDPRPL